MNGFSKLLACGLVALLHAPALAAPADLSWPELLPPAGPEITNPFEALTTDQIEALRTIHLIEGASTQTAQTDDRERAKALRAKLSEQGLDADILFAQRLEIMEHRRAAATRVNDTVLDRDIRIPGYLLPLEMRDRMATEFLLVPTVGACIHTPPPPANQTIYVTYPEGVEVAGLYDPVWIEGSLRGAPTVQDVRFIDGQSRVEVSYRMQADQVLPYRNQDN